MYVKYNDNNQRAYDSSYTNDLGCCYLSLVFTILYFMNFLGNMTDDAVKDVAEKDLNIPVQRLYPLQNENHRKLLEKIMGSDEIVLPYLYHRESKQSLSGGSTDLDDVRAWAKGRKPPQAFRMEEKSLENLDDLLGEDFDVLSDDDMEDVEDNASSLEKKGKQSVQRRTPRN